MSNIAINITENGTTTLATAGKYCDRNIDVSVAVAGSGGADLPEEAYTISGNCSRRFAYNGWNWFIDSFGSKVTTSDITNANQMFVLSDKITTIPFQLNFSTNSSNTIDMGYMFGSCNQLTTLPSMGNVKIKNCERLLNECYRVREIPEGFYKNFDYSYLTSQTSAWSGDMSGMFASCYSLRKVPREMIEKGNPLISNSYSYLCSMCNNCCALDELVNLPLYFTGTWTSNAFSASFTKCSRLKELTFELNEDNTPKVMKWKSQTIELYNYVGYAAYLTDITRYNSGITADKEVKDDTTYQALKNEPDWFTTELAYSRYNHDSAVETINSLPDTSAYLATAGGTNTIKFKGEAGSKTDGGAINTLTEEEIAVAAAKGWTVSLV